MIDQGQQLREASPLVVLEVGNHGDTGRAGACSPRPGSTTSRWRSSSEMPELRVDPLSGQRAIVAYGYRPGAHSLSVGRYTVATSVRLPAA